MKRVIVVIGTRPEAIKMMPVVRALRAQAELDVRILVTGQHRHMLDQVFETFDEQPDIDLNLMAQGQTLTDITVRVLEAMQRVIREEQPAIVLVHGDTTTAMAAALAAFYERVPVGHVEAGLRSHDFSRPWPEEYNRVAIDAVSTLLFAPTELAAENLQRENPTARAVTVTGNTGIDALFYVADKLDDAVLPSLGIELDPARDLILVTGHRRESFGSGFEQICAALARIAERPEVEIVYPVHLNPQVQQVVRERLSGHDNIHLLPPVSYAQMVALMKRAKIILTDSGGIQEEGPAMGKPVLVMRDVTERPEAIATGVASLVGTDPERICAEIDALLDDSENYEKRARAVFPYGDGQAAPRIAASVAAFVRTR